MIERQARDVLVLDVGNSRLKWGLRGRRGWVAHGAVDNQEIASLALRDWQGLDRPARVIGVNVAGEAARVRVEGQVSRWRLPVEWQHPGASGGGVVNGYRDPRQLGADRWAALVAARRRELARSETRSAVVVAAGTAVTIDALDADGRFRGGVIVPGSHLMVESLAGRTAALRTSRGHYEDFPATTADALASGAILAICGAIERMRARLSAGDAPVACYLVGGGAAELEAHLSAPVQRVDNLVLEGVLVLASRVS
ncbi:MAG TPA: type III pantothenate kinase [Casimicrobiaceae bacterium]|jgi:type III pantothenate kinase